MQNGGLTVEIAAPLSGSNWITYISGGAPLSLSGSVSQQPQGDTINYSWYAYLTDAGAAFQAARRQRRQRAVGSFDPRRVCPTTDIYTSITLGLEVYENDPTNPSQDQVGSSEIPITVYCEYPPQ